MRKLLLLLMVITCLSVTGCGGRNLMQRIDTATMNDSVSQDEAAIVFYRNPADSAFTSKTLIPIVGLHLHKVAPIMEFNEEEQLTLIAYLHPGWKYRHQTTPGKHLYVVGGNPAEILEANMDAGKTYYVDVEELSGFRANFEFEPLVDPVNAPPTGFNSEAWYYWMTNTPRGMHWFEKNKKSLQAQALTAYRKLQEAKPEDRKIILPEYGIITPIR